MKLTTSSLMTTAAILIPISSADEMMQAESRLFSIGAGYRISSPTELEPVHSGGFDESFTGLLCSPSGAITILDKQCELRNKNVLVCSLETILTNSLSPYKGRIDAFKSKAKRVFLIKNIANKVLSLRTNEISDDLIEHMLKVEPLIDSK
jgi:hypothetical protein